LHEANVQPGLTNRLFARRADVVCVGTAGAVSAFPAARTIVTGNPVRAKLGHAEAKPIARARLGLAPETRTVLVLGGSLGAARLNAWVLACQPRFAAHGLQVLWQ